MNARILTISGKVYPKAEILTCDAGNGVATFRWLTSEGNSVDSGGSVAKFTPLAPNPAEDGEPVTYPEVPDATIVAAIENPPPQELGRWRVLKDTIWIRVKELGPEKQAAATAAITALPPANRMDWDCQVWFWSDNLAIRQVLSDIGCTAAEVEQILSGDPLAP